LAEEVIHFRHQGNGIETSAKCFVCLHQFGHAPSHQVGDLLDLDAPFGTGNNDRCSGRTIHENRKIDLSLNFDRLCDQDFSHESPSWACLMSHQCLPQHFLGDLASFGRRFAEFDPAFETVRKGPFSPATRMDLRLNDEVRRVERCGNLLRFFRRVSGSAFWSCCVKTFKKLFCLIFVNIHLREELAIMVFVVLVLMNCH
jgi:hypothetical protein